MKRLIRRIKTAKQSSNSNSFSLSGLIPVFVFIFLLAAYAFSSHLSNLEPKINSISPEISYPGDMVEISGKYFGDPENKHELELRKPVEAAVVINGSRLVLSDYILWDDNRIIIRVPETAASGPLFIENKKGRSNEIVFINRKEIPTMLTGPVEPGIPYISSFEPAAGMVGSEIVIKGMNFGMEKGSSNVFFTLAAPEITAAGRELADVLSIPASDIEYDYISWTDNEIKVRVPDGSSSGKVWTITDRGESNSFYLEISETTGTRSFNDKRVLNVGYEVSADVLESSGENSISFWIPSLVKSPEQRNIEYERNVRNIQTVRSENNGGMERIESSSNTAPVLENYHGLMLYSFHNIKAESSRSVELTAWLERYEVNTSINKARVEWNYKEDSKFFIENTKNLDRIAIDDEKLEEISRLISRARDPYTKAGLIYNFLKRIKFDPYLRSHDVIGNYENRTGDSYTLAMMFTALARKAGIPARPVAGFFILEDKRAVKHFWAEFYIEKFGWVPVDPALGHGGIYGNQLVIDNPETYYFGNLDNRHVTFSKGIIPVPNISPSGKTVYKDKMYSLQTVYEETTGNLENLKTRWNDLKIIEWW